MANGHGRVGPARDGWVGFAQPEQATHGEPLSKDLSTTSHQKLRTICVRLAYEGTRYCGWQMQPGRMTVQGTLAEALKSITGESTKPVGSSRTDAGVHAIGQMAVFETRSRLTLNVLFCAINARLPPDIAVLDIREAACGFDPIRSAIRKMYRYRIHDPRWPPILGRHLVWRCRSQLNIDAMRTAAEHLLGKHDFTSFEKVPSLRLSKVRTIYSISIRRVSCDDDQPDAEIWIEIEGNGFLHNMVRIIVGSLVMVGSGRRSPEWMQEALASHNRLHAGPTAPAQGLVLVRIDFSDDAGQTPMDYSSSLIQSQIIDHPE